MRSARDSHNPSRPLPPPRFSLRALAIAITIFCILLSLSRWMEPSQLAAVLLILLAIGAHVAGNALGSSLRDGPRSANRRRVSPIALEEHHFAPVSKLSSKHSLGWINYLLACGGALFGMGAGWWFMHDLYGEALQGLALLITLLAFGVLGGIGTFLIGTFLYYLWQAWRQSHQHD